MVSDELDPAEPTEQSADELLQLLESRSEIESWLERLDDQSRSASRDVIERVRRDYRERLEQITEEIRRRQDSVARWLVEAQQRADKAAERRDHATSELEEGQLRHQIGEWTADRWDAARDQHQSTIEQARLDHEDATADIARLRNLLGEDGESEPDPTSADFFSGDDDDATTVLSDDAPIAAEPDQAEEDEPFHVVAESEKPIPASRPVQRTVPLLDLESDDDDADDLDLLDEEEDDAEDDDRYPSHAADDWEDLPEDVTLVPDAMPPTPRPSDSVAEDEFDPETVPKPGIKCGNCGYTNDAAAWFCGVCGADIG